MKVRELVEGVTKRVNDADKKLVSDFLENRLNLVNQAKAVSETLEGMYEELCDKDVKEVAALLKAEGQVQVTHSNMQVHHVVPAIDMGKVRDLFLIDMD